MKRLYSFALCAVALQLLLLCGAARAQQTSDTGVLRLAFQNSVSGVAIIPSVLTINGIDHASQVDRSGCLAVPLPDGRWEVHAEAKGYTPLTTMAVVSGANTLVNTLTLEPDKTAENATMEIGPDRGVLSGHVVDDSTGALLAGVDVAVPEKQVTAVTDSEGSFTLTLPLTGGTIDSPVTSLLTLRVSHQGYTIEERRNVEVISGQHKTCSIRLEPLGANEPGLKTVDEARAPGRVQTWVFDMDFE